MTGQPFATFVTHDEYHTQGLHAPILVAGSPTTWYPQSSSRLRGLVLFYLIAFISTLSYFVIYPLINYGEHPKFWDKKPIEFGWNFVFLSEWVGILQCVFFIFSLIDLHLRLKPYSIYLHEHKDRFYDVMFALTLLQFLFYSFVEFPKRINQYNLSMTQVYEDIFAQMMPCLFLLCETLMCVHRYASYPCHFIRDAMIPGVIVGAFAGWSVICKNKNGRYPYELLDKATDTQVALIFLTCAVVAMVAFTLGRTVARCFWSDQPLSAEYQDDAYGSYASFVAHESFTAGKGGYNSGFEHNKAVTGAKRGGAKQNAFVPIIEERV